MNSGRQGAFAGVKAPGKGAHTGQGSKGFTLIEVMVVIVVIGIMVSLVQFSTSGNRPEEKLRQASERFAGVFDIAAEYSMLNNVELGLLVDKNSYQFVGYDGVRWSPLADEDLFAAYSVPEDLAIDLELDDLPIEEPALYDRSTFEVEEEDSFSEEEEEKIIPQVYILSGGDITPFSLTFSFAEELVLDEEFAYRVTGLFTTPLTIEFLIDGKVIAGPETDE
ncbi:type II secretion system minor pseudopilin GspH [Thalassomonas haliotis]|uniref:Type II secretion system protein H n=1 Tax=Thalassomonas haliotis TaxID=485448 RepID=A0ABY7VD71_9GAMM|nr:type II secretion system minor pseudopilin GspH [Thalassomonas haliotis]WDE11628.1 type II secretion system minor pseudopilin GspH [Thalassomonas haliotis]